MFSKVLKISFIIIYLFSLNAVAGPAPSNQLRLANSVSYGGHIVFNEISTKNPNTLELFVVTGGSFSNISFYSQGDHNNAIIDSGVICNASGELSADWQITPSLSTCQFPTGAILTYNQANLHHDRQELVLLEGTLNRNGSINEDALLIEHLTYGHDHHDIVDPWEDDYVVVIEKPGNNGNVCAIPDGSLNNQEWNDCNPTIGNPNGGDDQAPVIGPTATCDVQFIDGLTNHSSSGDRKIKFKTNSYISFNPDQTLATPKLEDENSAAYNTCRRIEQIDGNHKDCIKDPVNESVTTLSLDASNFATPKVVTNYTVTLNAQDNNSTVKARHYKKITVNAAITVNFAESDSGNRDFYIDELDVDKGGTLNLTAGNYWIKDIKLPSPEVNLSINSLDDGVVNLYLFDDHIDFEEGISINYDDNLTNKENASNASKFHLYGWGKLHFREHLNVAALIYAQDDVYIRTGSTIYGAISSKKIELKEDSRVFYGCEEPKDNSDLYQISFVDSPTLTCEGLEVTVKACQTADCTEFKDIDSDITDLRILSSLSDAQFSVSISDDDNGLSIGKATVYQNVAGVSTLSLAGQSSVCKPEDCLAEFVSAALKLEANDADDMSSVCGITNQYTLQALHDVQGQCVSLFDDNVIIPVNFNTTATNLLINGETLAAGTPKAVDVSFDSGNGLVAIKLDDVGEYSLDFNLSIDLPELTEANNLYVAGSSTLTFYPEQFSISAAINNTHVAGELFTTTISALCENEVDTALDGAVAPSYQPEDDQINLSLSKGDADYRLGDFYLSESIDNSAFADSIVATVDFIDGVYQSTTSRYLEVGDLTLEVEDTYLGQVITGQATFSRFIPKNFKLTLLESGELTTQTCNALTNANGDSFTYTGQLCTGPLCTGVGDINYLVAPQFKLTPYAHTFSDETTQVTQNYIDQNTQVTLGASSTNTVTLVDDISDSQSLTFTQQQATPGILYFDYSMLDSFYYQRNLASQIAPFTAVFDMQISQVLDSDGVKFSECEINEQDCVCSSGSCQRNFSLEGDSLTSGLKVKFARWFIVSDTKGQEEQLPIEMQIQYWDGSNFVVNQTTLTNSGDSCTFIDDDLIELKDIGELATSDTQIEKYNAAVVNFADGKSNQFYLTPPNKAGAIGVKYQAPDWLQYPWNSDSNFDTDANPIGTMVFGVFSDSSQRIINQREIEGGN